MKNRQGNVIKTFHRFSVGISTNKELPTSEMYTFLCKELKILFGLFSDLWHGFQLSSIGVWDKRNNLVLYVGMTEPSLL